MDKAVPFETGGILVGFATIRALVGSDITVGCNVGVEVGRMTKGFITMRALVWGCGAVGSLMLLQVSFLPEILLTYSALKRPFSCMNFSVCSQVRLG